MARVAAGNVSLQGLRDRGMLFFSEEKQTVCIELVRGKVREVVPVSSLINITEPGVDKAVDGLDPQQKTREAVRDLLDGGLTDEQIFEMLRTRRQEKETELTAANESAQPPTVGNSDNAGTSTTAG